MNRWILGLGVVASGLAVAAPLKEAGLQSYFEGEVRNIEAENFAGIESREDWERERPRRRAELFEMLGIDPQRERGDLKAVVTGKVEREGIVVEKLHFQSSPGLYVTANFYRPAKVEKPLPAILYVCGHGPVKTNGVSYGNKVAYQHHGAWFARNGYACLILDTIELGEISGVHHGTYREGMWWWNARGYTPAGVEAWNCMRALDYLETRADVDKTRFGVTGRSGGGAYSWWIAALDDRIKVAAPVAGITDLRNHVVDGVVEGHCDCMFFVNTFRWDYPMVAALVAPRPLLIGNSDKDTIFPLDGVVRTHAAVGKIYEMLGAGKNFGLLITEGPHKDTQDLQLPVFRWFNRHLKGEDPVIEMAATKLFTGQELKVFEKIPEDEITSRIHETFVTVSEHGPKAGAGRMETLRDVLRHKSFAGWPKEKVPGRSEEKDLGNGFYLVEFDSQKNVRLKMYAKKIAAPKRIIVTLVPEETAAQEISAYQVEQRDQQAGTASVVLTVRNVGANTREADRDGVQIKRRHMLVGQTLDGMRVWDILRGIEFIKNHFGDLPIRAVGIGKEQKNLYIAKLFEPTITLAEMREDNEEPDYLNFLRFTSWDEIKTLVGKSEATK